jgi:hypothetical protein
MATDRPDTGAVRAFVLAEVLAVLVISGLVTAALLAAMVALIRGLQPQSVRLAGETLPIAPTFGAFASAVRLHQTFSDRLAAARAVYVFGGRHLAIPADAPAAHVLPLKVLHRPEIDDFSPGLPLDARSFYDSYAASLGGQETAASDDDFTILMIGTGTNRLAVSCLVQVRRKDVMVFDGESDVPHTVRDVRLWDEDGPQRYVFAERPAFSAGIFNGAVHTWLRYSAAEGTGEEGPACVVFPDPWIYGGTRGQPDDIPPFSRFSYFIAVSP